MPVELRFIADVMLGRLATWLRLLGCDVEYFRDIPDEDLVEQHPVRARDRDVELTRRRKARGNHFVRGDATGTSSARSSHALPSIRLGAHPDALPEVQRAASGDGPGGGPGRVPPFLFRTRGREFPFLRGLREGVLEGHAPLQRAPVREGDVRHGEGNVVRRPVAFAPCRRSAERLRRIRGRDSGRSGTSPPTRSVSPNSFSDTWKAGSASRSRPPGFIAADASAKKPADPGARARRRRPARNRPVPAGRRSPCAFPVASGFRPRSASPASALRRSSEASGAARPRRRPSPRQTGAHPPPPA